MKVLGPLMLARSAPGVFGKHSAPYALWTLLVLLGLGTLAPLPGCATAREISDRGELDVTLSRHHVDLRWGRIPNAARFVHRDLRATFVEDWERRLRHIEITDIEVLQVYEVREGVADVTVRIVYIDNRTMQLRDHTSSERWELADGYWLATRVAALDDNT